MSPTSIVDVPITVVDSLVFGWWENKLSGMLLMPPLILRGVNMQGEPGIRLESDYRKGIKCNFGLQLLYPLKPLATQRFPQNCNDHDCRLTQPRQETCDGISHDLSPLFSLDGNNLRLYQLPRRIRSSVCEWAAGLDADCSCKKMIYVFFFFSVSVSEIPTSPTRCRFTNL